MPLSAEQVYNDLTGQDCKEILITRCADLLNNVGEFQHHITLPRVRMVVSIHLEVWGRTPPTFDIEDDLVVRMRDVAPDPNDRQTTLNLEAEINSNTDSATGQPPDEIRVEHGLPVMTPQRGPFGMEDKPVIREGIKYAFSVTQDYGPMRGRTGQESPVIGGDVIAVKNAGGGTPDVLPNFVRVKDPGYADKYDPLDVNGQK